MLSMESSQIAYRYWKNCVLSMESCQTSLQVLEKPRSVYGKLSDITTGTGKIMS